MEIIKIINFIMNFWLALSTENEELAKFILLPFVIIETAVSVLLFSSILNIKSTRKQKLYYIFVIFIISTLSNLFIPKPFGTFMHMILTPILIMLFFKISFLKSIIAEIIPFVIIALLENIFLRIYLIVFNITYEVAYSIPIYRISFVLIIYLIMFLLYKIFYHFNFNINILDNMNLKNKRTLIINSILGLITIATQFYLIVFFNDNLPLFIVLLSSISLMAYLELQN